MQRSLAELCCINPEYNNAGTRGHGNLSVRTGKGGGRWRILKCSTYKIKFSERRGTGLFGSKVSPEKIVAVAAHLKEGCGIRKTSRLAAVSKSGVTSLAIRLGLHVWALQDERVRDLSVSEAQFDESIYEFSKVLLVHVTVSWWVLFCYNFHYLHRGLRQHLSDGSYLHRTPAMAMGDRRPVSLSSGSLPRPKDAGFVPSSVTTTSLSRLRHAPSPAP